MFVDLDNLEIWVVAYRTIGERIADIVRQHSGMADYANTIVWEVEHRKAGEEAHIRKVHGTHQDVKLNERIENEGLVCSPPRTELLVDPTLEYGERVFRIGRRILSFMASAYITEKERIVTIQDFRERYPDAIMTDEELKRCLRYLMRLVPEIGGYNSGTGEIVLARRPSLDKIKARLEEIQTMTEVDIKLELASLSKRVGGMAVKPKMPQKTTLDKWLPVKNAQQNVSSRLQSYISQMPERYNGLQFEYQENMDLTHIRLSPDYSSGYSDSDRFGATSG